MANVISTKRDCIMGKARNNQLHQFYVAANLESPIKRACAEMLTVIESKARADMALNPESLFERFIVKRNDLDYPAQALIAVPDAMVHTLKNYPDVMEATTKLHKIESIDQVRWWLKHPQTPKGGRFYVSEDARLCLETEAKKDLTVALVSLVAESPKFQRKIVVRMIEVAKQMSEEQHLGWKIFTYYRNGFFVDVRGRYPIDIDKRLKKIGQVYPVARIRFHNGRFRPAFGNN